jgi:1-acyl-sn-glycerol-3-phosphate acyltransferase
VLSSFVALVRFLAAWLYTLLCSSLCMLISLCGLPRLGWLIAMHPWGNGSLKILGIRINITGNEHFVGPALFLSNHQSLIDVVFLPAMMPRRSRWVAKKELQRVPFWGWAFGTSGAIFIDRKNPRAAIESIKEGLKVLPPDWSVVIFPEGTRSKDGRMLPFKKGALHIALQSRLPIVPIGIYGARHIVPKDKWLIRPGVVEVTAGPRLDPSHWTLENGDEHLAEMRAAVEACVEASRRRWAAQFPERAGELAEATPAGQPQPTT